MVSMVNPEQVLDDSKHCEEAYCPTCWVLLVHEVLSVSEWAAESFGAEITPDNQGIVENVSFVLPKELR